MPSPNQSLRRLLTETGWTEQQLARAVNAAGAETGLTLRYDRSAVSHWLAGRCPWGPVPALLAETLSRRLGRPVTLVDAGLSVQRAPDAQQGPVQQGTEQRSEDAIDMLVQLAAFSGERRRLLTNGAYSLAALAVPAWAQVRDPVRPSCRGGGQDRLVPGRVDAAEQMMSLFTDADANFGGGRARAALAAYLAYDVAPCLNAPASRPLHAKMLTVATQLTYLCAFMCFDQEKHPAAQQYYTVALQLSAENNDAAAYATTLRALSVQANHLGHHRQAIDLADAAVHTAPATSPPGTRAFLYGQAAVAAAGIGDRRTALAHLGRAESFLERGATAGATSGAYHQASLGHQRAAVLEALGDAQGAADALAASLRHRPAAERRARAVTLAALAQIHLRQGHLEPAAATWQKFLEDYPHLESGRARTALAMLRATLRPHQRTPAVAAVWAQSAAMGC